MQSALKKGIRKVVKFVSPLNMLSLHRGLSRTLAAGAVVAAAVVGRGALLRRRATAVAWCTKPSFARGHLFMRKSSRVSLFGRADCMEQWNVKERQRV